MSWISLCLTIGILAAALAACGASNESGAEELARQQELQAAREEAARDARQSARIAELEQRLSRARKRQRVPREDPPRIPVDDEGSLLGLWKGEAVIRYDSGEADPFNQTIEIDSLTLGAISGYSEAHQGSTTCHGPLTYEGVSEGWYRFSSEERNVDQCIDFSLVELMPNAGGDLSYRETTDVAVSNGTLGPVR